MVGDDTRRVEDGDAKQAIKVAADAPGAIVAAVSQGLPARTLHSATDPGQRPTTDSWLTENPTDSASPRSAAQAVFLTTPCRTRARRLVLAHGP